MTPPRRGRRLWWTALLLLAVPPLPVVFFSCKNPIDVPSSGVEKGPPWFEDVTRDSDIVHTYDNGQNVPALTLDGRPLVDKDGHPVPDVEGKPLGHLAILESLGGGAGLLDFDGDGLLDVFLPGGGTYIGASSRTIVGRPCHLYKNLGNFKFRDVTAEAGLDRIDFYTHGVAVADYNRDGWPDLLVTGWGRLALFRNDPVDPKDPTKGRKFTEVTKDAGLNDHEWSTSAGWADFDGDGHVDLYVCHYVNWHFGKTVEEEKKHHPECSYDGRTRDVCPPRNFDGLPHVVYRNNGNGTFTDVSKEAGLRVPRTEGEYAELHKLYVAEARARLKGPVTDADREAAARQVADEAVKRLRDADAARDYGKGLGVVIVDINGDGKPDVYVACDTVDNLLYVNRSRPGQILFEEVGLAAGVARDDHGGPNGSMGADAFDSTGSLRPSLWCVNYENEKHALYQNDCTRDRVVFRYATQTSGIAAIGQAYVGWGTRFVDFDLDGLEDLFVSNGHAIRFPVGKSKRFQRPVLMQCYEAEDRKAQGPQRKFRDMTATNGGPYCEADHCGRGVAFGDLDNDGRVDMVLAHLNEPAAVLKTVAGQGRHWLGFELKRKDHRDPVGAKVVLEAAGKKQVRFAKGGGSYASANDPRHVFGLGDGQKMDRVTVTWPDLTEQTWEGLAVDRYWKLVEGKKDAE
jgi:hypothetical protein